MKICSKCKKEKSPTEFYKHIRMKSGLSSRCKPCCGIISKEWASKNKEKRIKAVRDFRARNPEAGRRYELKRVYGISVETYERMFREQNGGCKICGKQNLDGKRLSVDHDHNTGTIRGLLCHRCNGGLGHFFDDPYLFQSAIKYLTENSKETV